MHLPLVLGAVQAVLARFELGYVVLPGRFRSRVVEPSITVKRLKEFKSVTGGRQPFMSRDQISTGFFDTRGFRSIHPPCWNRRRSSLILMAPALAVLLSLHAYLQLRPQKDLMLAVSQCDVVAHSGLEENAAHKGGCSECGVSVDRTGPAGSGKHARTHSNWSKHEHGGGRSRPRGRSTIRLDEAVIAL